MFRDLGMRFSKYNQRHALAGVSDIIDQRNYNYIEAIKIAVMEDSIAYF
jgi:hypothetical protein